MTTPALPATQRFSFDNRYLAPILVTLVLIVGQVTFGFLESWSRTFLAIGVSIAVELLLGRLLGGAWPHLASSYISGISIGMLIRSPEFWPYALCAAISITSKYVLRMDGRHLWNPSNFGVSAVLFLAPQTVSLLSIQWGNNIWPMLVIWVLGFVIVWRVGRLHVSATYVAAFVAFAFLRSAITGNPWQATLAPITGPMYQLFIFFMVTDPKVSVGPKWAQVVVVIAVAFVEMLLRLNEVIYAPFYSLCLVGPAALLIEMAITARRRVAIPVAELSHGGNKV
jgi:hypothetical protein